MPRALYLLSLCNLVLGTGAFVLAGILQPIADGLGVGVGAAGQAITAYAVATAVLAPLALLATGGWRRRDAMVASMAVFAAGNALCAVAGSLGVLIAGRVVMGIGAAFTPLAASIALALVPPQQRGRALALVFLGISLSYVVGLPLGAWLGLRFGWHWPIALVAVASLACCVLLVAGLPRDIAAPGASRHGAGAMLRNRQVASTFGLTLLYFTAIFTVFAYSGPVLTALVPMSREALALTLASFGISGVIGTVVGGWANDRFGAPRTLTVQLAVLATMMALVPLTRGSHALLVMVFFVWGVAGFGMMAPQQSRLAVAVPQQAPLALSLNTSMLYLGTAAGAAVGGAAVGWLGFDRIAWAGVPFALAGWVLLQISRPKTTQSSPTPAERAG